MRPAATETGRVCSMDRGTASPRNRTKLRWAENQAVLIKRQKMGFTCGVTRISDVQLSL